MNLLFSSVYFPSYALFLPHPSKVPGLSSQTFLIPLYTNSLLFFKHTIKTKGPSSPHMPSY